MIKPPPYSLSFEVALFKTGKDERGENKGDHHNPTRQPGIDGNIGTARNRKPSLARQIGIAANSQLQNA